jgi:hypothetical protein
MPMPKKKSKTREYFQTMKEVIKLKVPKNVKPAAKVRSYK